MLFGACRSRFVDVDFCFVEDAMHYVLLVRIPRAGHPRWRRGVISLALPGLDRERTSAPGVARAAPERPMASGSTHHR